MNNIISNIELFKIASFSKTAIKHEINNCPNSDQCNNIIQMYENVVKPINDMFSNKMYITSWFRNEKVNKLVGGWEYSRHLLGMAVDFYINDKERDIEKVFNIIKKNLNVSFYKLILYKKRGFIHISYSFEPSELLQRNIIVK
jgi:uncharacterized protein YcbK (DUF882 family)